MSSFLCFDEENVWQSDFILVPNYMTLNDLYVYISHIFRIPMVVLLVTLKNVFLEPYYYLIHTGCSWKHWLFWGVHFRLVYFLFRFRTWGLVFVLYSVMRWIEIDETSGKKYKVRLMIFAWTGCLPIKIF